MALNVQRTNSDDQDFIQLVRNLDQLLAVVDGSEHAFYSQYNKLDKIKHVVVVYEGEEPIGCGAIKEYGSRIVEVKRMFTVPTHRGKGLATMILKELENWASELGYETCVLETGKRLSQAVGLYKSNGYSVIPNYGQYVGVDNSICFEKQLKS